MKDIVSKLKEAGINASLVHKIQDETCISIDTPIVARDLANLLIQGSGVGYEGISDTIREKGYSPVEVDFSRWYHSSKLIVAPKGGRSISKPTMDDND